MFKLSTALDDARAELLAGFPRHLSHWPVVHLTVVGETSDENYKGIGPWARIWSLPTLHQVCFPDGYREKTRHVRYVIALFLPRAVTTNSLLETLIHEYLHVGAAPGELNYHPPRDEQAFISASQALARAARKLELPGIRKIDLNAWQSHAEPVGLTIHGFEGEVGYAFRDPIVTEEICLKHFK